MAFVSLCLLSLLLVFSAQAHATARDPKAAGVQTGAVGAIAQSGTQELASATNAPVAEAGGGAAVPSPPTHAQPEAPAPQTTPRVLPLNAPVRTGESDALAPAPRATGVVTVLSEASERIARTRDVPVQTGRGAARAIADTATAAVSATSSAPVSSLVRRVGSSRAGVVVGDLTRTVTRATQRVTGATGTTRVVRTLAHDATTFTTTIVHTTGLGKPAIEELASSIAPKRAWAHAPAFTTADAVRSPRSQPPGSITPAPPSIERGVVERAPLTATWPPAQVGFEDLLLAQAGGRPSMKALPRAGVVAIARVALDLPRGQSAVLSPARGAHRAPLPASPTPTPSPGAVSPVAAVGAGAGLSPALALAALLMLAAPPAQRRLRLHGECWRLMPFALIAGRPG